MDENFRVEVLISAQEIDARVRKMAAEITADYEGRDLVLIGALQGCFIFMADLARRIQLPRVYSDFVELSSYGDSRESSGTIELKKDVQRSITDRHVLIVEDIIDTGRTLNFLYERLRKKNPASLKIAALLVKEGKHRLNQTIDYAGFSIEDRFVIGYGMDFAGAYRNLDHIAVLEEAAAASLPSTPSPPSSSPSSFHS